MVKKEYKLLERAYLGSKNIRFEDMVSLVQAFGFKLVRVRGSHHIFVHPHIPEKINLQEVNGQAKPYQIKQFLSLVETYNMTMGED